MADPSSHHTCALEKRGDIVAVFVCTATATEGDCVLMLKRSSKAREYPNKWAPCHGPTIETDTDLLGTAWRVIYETYEWTNRDVRLLRPGKPYRVPSLCQCTCTEWIVHPFAFVLQTHEITLNEEYCMYYWVPLGKLNTYDTIPGIVVGAQRCLVPTVIAGALQAMAADTTSGAREMATAAVDTLSNAILHDGLGIGDSTEEERWSQLQMCAWHLAYTGRPNMAASISNAILKSLHTLDQCRGPSGGIASWPAFRERASTALLQYIMHRNKLPTTIATNLARHLDPRRTCEPGTETILTLSHSSTVRRCIVERLKGLAKHKKMRLLVLESRPLFEGVTFASSLLSEVTPPKSNEKGPNRYEMSKLEIEIASDCSVMSLAGRADYLILGADKISRQGAVLNKIGSLSAAVAARNSRSSYPRDSTVVAAATTDTDTGTDSDTETDTDANTPKTQVIVLAESDKIVGEDAPESIEAVEEHDPAELAAAWPLDETSKARLLASLSVRVRNAYFEWVPADLIDVYISELGVLKREDIARIAAEAAELARKMFDAL
ncbi:MAG: hypothetical protein M1825_005807 [Sarcosagium campestre]|nr:MAG: hypothetical protein M1825_005807 [Sarcosagium campestre]